ncbi:uncharacterized protein BDR25DRAFT_342591 [Lindgomyces ingoldianus]|uniref:Uncharacterized protein n=1 Tax=Lindgomyces ingoldianus TaxID=673940 RepID=A0ACB6QWP3_9PLEO|nr:uncharacterized protein BDR25DRAFT_342591 [Lindgomyces ingoldianus]KAF2471300.1 hypothetical protein BDR25DRAFT_342591 [Lindgomyces ingoldianus]
MSKTSVFTTITPLPAGITRQSVLDTYHDHVEMINLNPLVVERFKCKPPSYATAEEFHATWYTIKDKVSYLPGGLATGSISYHACFHDLPEGLQTHVYAPLGLDIRAKWTVGGNLPGEPKQAAELGLGIPREGLYIREDVKMKCNIMMISFVKKTFKESHSKLSDRLVEKAHIIEAKLANERLNGLKELAPGERMGHGQIPIAPPPGYASGHLSMYSNGSGHSPLNSPGLSHVSTVGSQSPYLGSPPYQAADPRLSCIQDQKVDPQASWQPSPGYQTLDPRYQQQHEADHRQSAYAYQYPQQQQNQHPSQHPAELPSEAPAPPPKDDKKFTAELPA